MLNTAVAAGCPPLPSLPELSDEDRRRQEAWKDVSPPYSAADWTGGYDYAPFGIGHLRVKNASGRFYDWLKDIMLPVWRQPAGALESWVYAGVVHPVDGALSYPLTGAGLVETGYEHQTFIVSEETDDGWLKIRLKLGDDGELWTHACHLDLGDAKLVYQRWEAVLVEHGEWLHFRAQVPHALRSLPDVHSSRITWIGLNHELTLVEREGDWLRVRVRQPASKCLGTDHEFKGRIDEGWVKWRDQETGPWVWFYTRGC